MLTLVARDPHRSIRDEVAGKIKSLQSQFPRFKPQLAIIQAGARPDSAVYVRMKAKAAEEVGIAFKHVQVPEEAEVSDIVDIVKKLNDDETVSGILVQLALGPHVGAEGERTVTEAVSREKDVDGYVLYLPSETRSARQPRRSLSGSRTRESCHSAAFAVIVIRDP